MFKSNFFGRIFWIDDNNDFKSCPLCVDNTGDFDQVDIHHACIINKVNHAGSLSLNDFAINPSN